MYKQAHVKLLQRIQVNQYTQAEAAVVCGMTLLRINDVL
ncbi:protein of unknown function [Methylotuvimicrobium alcaliphilum 20Z]|uniref:Transposase n=1 Tax=Methylotuvimicrobium alcaliphilum (strain DSM 19304 / NCIMB 14124 / VKM B-2133 / 20Z) TaxID=1091494 RepID=G4SY57_META2|nr:protein of unknown function [Methylotuvimicrobium alcaliphilum 20Z]